MELDRAGIHDIARQQPQEVERVEAKWEGWAAHANVLPAWGGYEKPARR